MRPASRMKPGMTVRKLLQQGLEDTKRTAADLAQAVEVPVHYVNDLLSGRRRPPLPARTDLYEKMTRYLRLGRTDLSDCARAERSKDDPRCEPPDSGVRDQMLELCEAETAPKLTRRSGRNRDELVDLIRRVLDVAQGSARRSLDDQIPLRIAAARLGTSYPEMRLRVLEFLDASPATLTADDLNHFVRPHIALWDVDLESGVLRVVLRSAGSTERHQRRPIVRGGRARLAG